MNANFPELVPRLQQLYGRVDKLDLYIGGLIEQKEAGSMLGATFRCIIGDQFKRLKVGDRFWYENGPEANKEGAFTQGRTRQNLLTRSTTYYTILIQLMDFGFE